MAMLDKDYEIVSQITSDLIFFSLFIWLYSIMDHGILIDFPPTLTKQNK